MGEHKNNPHLLLAKPPNTINQGDLIEARKPNLRAYKSPNQPEENPPKASWLQDLQVDSPHEEPKPKHMLRRTSSIPECHL